MLENIAMWPESMYDFRMIWIIAETLLIVGGVFALNRFLRRGIEHDLYPRNILDQMYIESENEGEEDAVDEPPLDKSKKLPKT